MNSNKLEMGKREGLGINMFWITTTREKSLNFPVTLHTILDMACPRRYDANNYNQE